jgi:hypothetical protein
MVAPLSSETVMVMAWELLEVLMTVIVPVNVAVVAMSESSLPREHTRANTKGRARALPLIECGTMRSYGVVTIASSMKTLLPKALMPRKPSWMVVPL